MEDALTLSESTGVMRQSSQWEKSPERGARKPLQVSLKRVPRGHNHLFLSSLSCFHISPFQLPSFIITIITSPLSPYIALAWQSLRSQSNNLPIFACIPVAEHLRRGKNPSLSMTTFILKSWARITRGCSTFVQFSHRFSSFSTFPDHYFRAFPTSILASFLPDITLSASDFTSHSVEKKENLPEGNT